jgi:dihydropteroate synthase
VSAATRLPRGALRVRDTVLPWGARTYVMGIVNVTPDSFSGDGRVDPHDAVAYALAQLDAGADLLDVGAESTRPGSTPLDAATERARLVPAIALLRERAPRAVISVDTFKADVFRAAHAAGGDMLNSIWGLDDALAAAAAETHAPIVVMHNKRVAVYEGDVMAEVLDQLAAAARRAEALGIARERIILDPGIGFGKGPEENLAVLGSLERLVALGYPTLLGTSRKSTIGKLTGRGVDDRAFGTAAAVALAVRAGIDIVRVHDVAPMLDVVRVGDAIVRGWRPGNWRSP